jgi:hypothetical protein
VRKKEIFKERPQLPMNQKNQKKISFQYFCMKKFLLLFAANFRNQFLEQTHNFSGREKETFKKKSEQAEDETIHPSHT